MSETQESPKGLEGPDLSDLQSWKSEAESVDAEIFAEMRSNILLIAGEHYSRTRSNYWGRIRDSKQLSQEQKLRLTKNHIYKIMRGYSNSISSYSPFVTCQPKDPKDLSDQKEAELRNGLLQYTKRKYRMKEKVRDWCDDFTGIGEVGTKIFFDPTLGKPVGYEQSVDEEGLPEFDELGIPVPSDNMVRTGDFVFEVFYGFNLLRAANAKTMEDSPQLTIRKMLDVKALKAKYKDQPEKLKCFQETNDGTYLVFDPARNSYGRSKNQCLVFETFYRPGVEYPNGYFVYWTDNGIFEEGELPFGIFPLAFGAFDKFQTSPRGRSHIKVLRPFQAEINRSASKMAEHQVTLGDDKVISQMGSKIQEGQTLPGIRGIVVGGPPPTILPGRDGSQYLNYHNSEIQKMYQASLLEYELQEAPAQLDPYTLLYRAASQKKKFTVYTERFEQFLIDVFTIFFALAKHYMPDEELLEAFGKDNYQHLETFRSEEPGRYQITIEAQADDMETKLGQQLVLNHFLQFAGGQLDKSDIGTLLKASPYANQSEAFADLTLDSDIATNAILSLEKGKPVMVHSEDNHPYMIKKYNSRIRKPDFELLSPQIQKNFHDAVIQHENFQKQQVQATRAAEADFIPTGGALIVVDMYVPDPKNPESSKRARLPYEAINWLIQRLQQQGTTQDMLNSLPGQIQAQVAQRPVGASKPVAPAVPMGAPQ